MAPDELRKKWGTVFMGEREAGMAELAAMQEPLRQERLKQKNQDDYLENVRARATERAREILVTAYAEREKLLEDARREAQEYSLKLERESQALKAGAEAESTKAAQERETAAALRQEAENIREAAHSEGFQAGMNQAGEELKAFRADLGDSLAALLRVLDSQRHAINAFWREDMAGLVRAAAAAGTGWLLQSEHETILRALVLNALDMLEDRASLVLRVHPDDEAQIGSLFAAAREQAPELKQWIVSADQSFERGDFTVESGHGSVEIRREYFRNMVEGVLANLALPAAEDGMDHASAGGEDVQALVEREVAKITALAGPGISGPSVFASAGNGGPPPGSQTVPAEISPDAADAAKAAKAASRIPVSETESPDMPEPEPVPESVSESVRDSVSDGPEPESLLMAAGAEIPEPGDTPAQAVMPAAALSEQGGEAWGPTMAELEDELFSQDDSPDNSGNAPAVFSEGGFLPDREDV